MVARACQKEARAKKHREKSPHESSKLAPHIFFHTYLSVFQNVKILEVGIKSCGENSILYIYLKGIEKT